MNSDRLSKNYSQCQIVKKQSKDRYGRTKFYETRCNLDTNCYDKVSWDVIKDISKEECKPDIVLIKQIDGNSVECITTCSSRYQVNDYITLAITLIVVFYTFIWTYKLSKGKKKSLHS